MNKTKKQLHHWTESKPLFHSNLIDTIETLSLDFFKTRNKPEITETSKRLRLGKMVERFFSSVVKSNPRFRLLIENFQIIKEGITLGEIDFLIEDLQNQEILHVELVHKFYLFKPESKKIEARHFVGPNLNDSLEKKLSKLKEKQFPIVYDSYCQKLLQQKGIDLKSLKQKLLFTGSLYLNFKEKRPIELLNNKCIQGVWMNLSEFREIHQEENQYQIPNKLDWLSDPKVCLDWMEPVSFWNCLESEIENKYSPMIWKKSKDKIESLFVVWWD